MAVRTEVDSAECVSPVRGPSISTSIVAVHRCVLRVRCRRTLSYVAAAVFADRLCRKSACCFAAVAWECTFDIHRQPQVNATIYLLLVDINAQCQQTWPTSTIGYQHTAGQSGARNLSPLLFLFGIYLQSLIVGCCVFDCR